MLEAANVDGLFYFNDVCEVGSWQILSQKSEIEGIGSAEVIS
jgi:hypothetical protein